MTQQTVAEIGAKLERIVYDASEDFPPDRMGMILLAYDYEARGCTVVVNNDQINVRAVLRELLFRLEEEAAGGPQ